MKFLCDIGGTNCRIATVHGDSFNDIKKYKISDYPNFEVIFREYIKNKNYKNAQIYMGLAANPDGNIYHFKNQAIISNDWIIDPIKIKNDFSLSEVHIFDDFITNSMAIPKLNNSNYNILRSSDNIENKPKCIIGVGTGLGLSYAIPTKNHYEFIRTYGGHISLTCVTDEQYEYKKLLSKKINRTIIFEDFLCGHGVLNLHNIISEVQGINNKIKDDNELLYLLNNNKDYLEKTLRIFSEFYGLFAHIAVSTTSAYGGLYLTGGVTDSLVEKDLLFIDDFIKSFEQNMVPVVAEGLSNTPIFYPKIDLLSFHGLLYAIDNNIKGENV